MVDNFQRLLDADLGLRAEQLLSIAHAAAAALRHGRAPHRARRASSTRRPRALPGAERAGIVTVNPLDRGSFGARDRVRRSAARARTERADRQPSPRHRRAGSRPPASRCCAAASSTATDTATSTPVAIVSRRHGRSPVARRAIRSASASASRGPTRRGSPSSASSATCATPASGARRGTCRTSSTRARSPASTVHVMVRSRVDAGGRARAPCERRSTSIDPLLAGA